MSKQAYRTRVFSKTAARRLALISLIARSGAARAGARTAMTSKRRGRGGPLIFSRFQRQAWKFPWLPELFQFSGSPVAVGTADEFRDNGLARPRLCALAAPRLKTKPARAINMVSGLVS